MNIKDRFKDFEWCPDSEPFYGKHATPVILLGGAGGISSWTMLFLSRIGYGVVVFDFDRIEQLNLGGQFYKQSQIGELKVKALVSNVIDFGANPNMTSYQAMEYLSDSSHSRYAICGFDNMKARKVFYEVWKSRYGDVPTAIFIDGRLSAEIYQIFTIRGTDYDRMDEYEAKHLFDDEEVEDGPCTMKQTSHIAAMIGGNITGIFTNHIANVVMGNPFRVIPFYVNYMSSVQMLETTK